jgi:type I restriction enzyme S subunit
MTEWTDVVLSEAIDLAYGKSLPAHTRQAGPFEVFGSNGRVGHHAQPLIRGPGIIVGRKGSVGEIVYSASDFWPIDTTYYVVNKGRHDWRFLYHLLSSLGLDKLNSHSAVPGLNREDVYSIPTKLPPKAEQEQIALSLDTVQCSMEFESEAIQRSQELKRAAMRELFTRGLRGEAQKETEIGPVPESWDVLECKELTEEITVGVVVKPASYYVTDGIPAFRSLNIKEDRIDASSLVYFSARDNDALLSKSKLKAGDVLVVRTGYPGTSCVVPEEFDGANCIDLVIAKPKRNRVKSDFLSRFLNSKSGKSQVLSNSHGLAQQHLNVGAVRRLKLPVPPTLEEQAEIVAILDAIDCKIDLHRNKRAVLAELFKEALHQLMTGEIRVDDLDLSALAPARIAEAAQ